MTLPSGRLSSWPRAVHRLRHSTACGILLPVAFHQLRHFTACGIPWQGREFDNDGHTLASSRAGQQLLMAQLSAKPSLHLGHSVAAEQAAATACTALVEQVRPGVGWTGPTVPS